MHLLCGVQFMKIIPIAFSARDFSDFESVLSLAASRLSSPWTLGDSTDAGDFHIVSLNQPDDLSTLLNGSPTLDLWRVIAYADSGSEAAAHWILSRREGSPPRLSELISLLNTIDQHFKDAASSELGQATPSSSPDGQDSVAAEPLATGGTAAVDVALPSHAASPLAADVPSAAPPADDDLSEVDARAGKRVLDGEMKPDERVPALSFLEKIGQLFGLHKE